MSSAALSVCEARIRDDRDCGGGRDAAVTSNPPDAMIKNANVTAGGPVKRIEKVERSMGVWYISHGQISLGKGFDKKPRCRSANRIGATFWGHRVSFGSIAGWLST